MIDFGELAIDRGCWMPLTLGAALLNLALAGFTFEEIRS